MSKLLFIVPSILWISTQTTHAVTSHQPSAAAYSQAEALVSIEDQAPAMVKEVSIVASSLSATYTNSGLNEHCAVKLTDETKTVRWPKLRLSGDESMQHTCNQLNALSVKQQQLARMGDKYDLVVTLSISTESRDELISVKLVKSK